MERQQITPNFFILGAAKAGTTSLYEYLKGHPDIFLSAVKEPQFFCNDDLFNKGFDFYLNLFFSSSENFKARGEATPHYLYYEKVARRIAELIPKKNQKFIVIMRDPVKRAYSLYWNMVYEGYEKLSFEEAIAAEKQRYKNLQQLEHIGTIRFQYVDSSLYAKQIQRYLNYFEKKQFLFLFQHDFWANRNAVLQKIYNFLEVSEFFPDNEEKLYNTAGRPRFRSVHRFIRETSTLKKQLGRLLPSSIKYRLASLVLNLNRKSVKYPPMEKNMEENLRKLFKDDVLELETITEQSLADWLPANNQP